MTDKTELARLRADNDNLRAELHRRHAEIDRLRAKLEPEWMSAPDGEGWWCRECCDGGYCYNEVKKVNGKLLAFGPGRFIGPSAMSGRWCRAIIPGGEK